MSEPIAPSSDIEALLEAERAVPAASPALKLEVRALLDASVAAVDVRPSASPPAGPSALSSALSSKLVLALASFALGGASVKLLTRNEGSSPPPQAVSTRVEVPSPVTPTPVANAPSPPAHELPRRSERKTPAPHDLRLAQERALLERAHTALDRDSPTEALTALAEHERRFPSGALSEEREGLTIQALVLSGDVEAARARVEELRRRYPQSLLLPALEEALHEPR